MWLLRHVDWQARLHAADCLITGEGQVDAQTLMGKGVGVLIQQAVSYTHLTLPTIYSV